MIAPADSSWLVNRRILPVRTFVAETKSFNSLHARTRAKSMLSSSSARTGFRFMGLNWYGDNIRVNMSKAT